MKKRPTSTSRTARLLVLTFTAIFFACCTVPEIRIDSPTLGTLPDGTYEGSYNGGLSTAKVRLSLRDGRIVGFEILSLESGLGEPARAVASRVVEAQSLAVDVVSGATYSSRVILKAAEIALSSEPTGATP